MTQLLETELPVPDAALAALQRESRHLAGLALMFAIRALKLAKLHPSIVDKFPPSLGYAQRYRYLKQVEGEIIAFGHALQQQSLSAMQSKLLQQCLDITRHAVFSGKALRDIRRDVRSLSKGNGEHQPVYETLLKQQQSLYLELVRSFRQINREDSQVAKLTDLKTRIRKQFDDNQKQILMNYNQFQEDLSTLLNMNRELRTANEQLLSVFSQLQALTLP